MKQEPKQSAASETEKYWAIFSELIQDNVGVCTDPIDGNEKGHSFIRISKDEYDSSFNWTPEVNAQINARPRYDLHEIVSCSPPSVSAAIEGQESQDATASGGELHRKVFTRQDALDELSRIFKEVQRDFHDQWDWMEAEFAAECLRTEFDHLESRIAEAEKERDWAYRQVSGFIHGTHMLVPIGSIADLNATKNRAEQAEQRVAEQDDLLRDIVQVSGLPTRIYKRVREALSSITTLKETK